MIITILEGRVESERWETFKRTFESSSQQLPPPIRETYLIQATADPQLWRIITVWHSREALQQYRTSVETPEGVLMFRAAGAEPTLSIFDVIDYAPK